MTSTRSWKRDENGPRTDAAHAALIRSMLAFREQLLALDSWLPFPQNSCCYGFGDESLPLPVGALFLLWDGLPDATGQCPECGGKVYAWSFGGLLSTGGAKGSCVACEASLFMAIGGAGTVADLIGPVLHPTEFHLGMGLFGGSKDGPRQPLVDALRALGATDLPSKRWTSTEVGSAVSLTVRTRR